MSTRAELIVAVIDKTAKPINQTSAIHEPHLLKDRASAYRGISGEQFHGSKAS